MWALGHFYSTKAQHIEKIKESVGWLEFYRIKRGRSGEYGFGTLLGRRRGKEVLGFLLLFWKLDNWVLSDTTPLFVNGNVDKRRKRNEHKF
jgi:hypothetical protein